MPDSEFMQVRRRLDEVEGEVAGEKIVTRHILDQLRQNTDVLLEMRKEITGLHQKLDRLADSVALQGAHLTAFQARLPDIVGDVMRESYKTRERE